METYYKLEISLFNMFVFSGYSKFVRNRLGMQHMIHVTYHMLSKIPSNTILYCPIFKYNMYLKVNFRLYTREPLKFSLQYLCYNFIWIQNLLIFIIYVQVRSCSGPKWGPFNRCPFNSDETLFRCDSVSKCLGIDLMVPFRVPSETSFETSLMSERFVIGRRIW